VARNVETDISFFAPSGAIQLRKRPARQKPYSIA
jgi:hypothetical protein